MNKKPLFRWTVGNCLPQGLEILVESIYRTTEAFGVNSWDWAVFYNGLNGDEVGYLQEKIGELPVKLVSQNWATCPVRDNCQTPRRNNGTFEYDGKNCGGTMWKVCPARVRMETHEIVADNDVIILKKFDQIEEWLNQTEKSLILEEPIRFYGRYDKLFPYNPPFFNSGFMGMPPGFDFAKEIKKTWTEHGSLQNLSQADEQGLLTYTLNKLPSIRIKSTQMIEFLHRDFANQVTGEEEGCHFTQANRMPNHPKWIQYQKIMRDRYEQ